MSRPALYASLLFLVLGALLGVFIGWVVAPVRYVDADPSTLNPAYKDDYLLMIAAAYAGDADLAAARQRLVSLGFADPAAATAAAAERMEQAGAPPADLQRVVALALALSAAGSTPQPR
jgi:hypothetical protein